MSILRVPAEIQQMFLQDLCLASLVALHDACREFRTLLASLDGSVIREKVTERVPWMEIGQPGTGLSSWMDCARLIVARRQSMISCPQKWLDTVRYGGLLGRIVQNIDLVYIEPIELNNKGPGQEYDTLPSSYKPVFSTTIPTPCGGLTGKYMEVQSDEHEDDEEPETRYIDLTTCEYHHVHPHPRPKPATLTKTVLSKITASGESVAIIPNSDVRVVDRNGLLFFVLQETSKWVVVRQSGGVEGEVSSTKFVIDKDRTVVQQDGQKYLYFDSHTHENCSRVSSPSRYTVLHVLPDSQGAIVLEYLEDEGLWIFYDNLSSDQDKTLLVSLPLQNDDIFETLGNEMSLQGTRRQLIVTYGGMLYFQWRQRYLIPLWIDFVDEPGLLNSSQHTLGGLRTDMKTLLLAAKEKPVAFGDGPLEWYAEGVVQSENQRWAVQKTTAGRTIVDLSRQKTYIVRTGNRTDKNARWEDFVIVGLDEAQQLPVFYLCHLDTNWPDMFGSLDHKLACFLQRRRGEEHEARLDLKGQQRRGVIRPNPHDQNQKGVPLEWENE
ncbi:YALIA101S10e03774g1_1 [Yarrowia lipolytica]|nr:Hypothetical protein YALI2_A00076g [Yarrowia lipolytica]SEI36222.1 YALIA101S10e03774g1_1 [Yarrowia lipolytica]VBB88815.1 Hypothetical protein of a 30-member gene family, conserved in the Yarrowia clade [Yarrowia lipolytica]